MKRIDELKIIISIHIKKFIDGIVVSFQHNYNIKTMNKTQQTIKVLSIFQLIKIFFLVVS